MRHAGVLVLVQVAKVQMLLKVGKNLQQMEESGTMYHPLDLVLLRTLHDCMTFSLPVG